MKKQLLNSIIMTIDILLLISIFYLTLYLRVGISNIESLDIPILRQVLLEEFYSIMFIVFILMYYEKIYIFRYDFWQETYKVLKSFVMGFLIVLALLALTKTNIEYSRLFISIYFILGFILMPIAKRYVKKLIFSFDFFRKKVLLLGTDEQINIFRNEFDKNWYLGQRYSKENYDSVIISSKGMSVEKVNNLITTHLDKNSELYVVPYITDINFVNSNIMEYSNIRYNAIQVENKLLIKRNIFIKQIFDKLVILLMLPVFLLIHLIISLLIKSDSKGKIFFKQHRLGKNDNDFKCYKYRSMHEESDELLEKYLKQNPDEVEYYEKYHKYKKDPRITKIGKILRATSLDELPQVWNILKGEMSLVGPRPYMLNESDKLGSNQHLILKVNPGITGLWQVSGRNNLTFKQRNELEIWYIKNWSLWADFVILIKTVKVVLLKIGAR